jgi:hypothetical protein
MIASTQSRFAGMDQTNMSRFPATVCIDAVQCAIDEFRRILLSDCVLTSICPASLRAFSESRILLLSRFVRPQSRCPITGMLGCCERARVPQDRRSPPMRISRRCIISSLQDRISSLQDRGPRAALESTRRRHQEKVISHSVGWPRGARAPAAVAVTAVRRRRCRERPGLGRVPRSGGS